MRTSLAILTLAAVGTAAAAPPAPTAEEGFEALVQACKEGSATDLAALLPDTAASTTTEKRGERPEEHLLAWRSAFAASLSKATVVEVRSGKGRAVARYREGRSREEREVPLVLTGSTWVVDAPEGHLVKGRALDRANGRKPATISLTTRTVNGPYGSSAFSFAHVTRDPAECLNRMDLWYCHNGDLHCVADSRLARVAAEDLDSVTGIPESAAWKDSLAPEGGGVYVLHARRDRHRDFYVKLLVTEARRKGVTLRWSLLAAGPGSPPSIHSPHPLVSNDGADGYDGLCGRSAERSKPEPVPEGGTVTPK